MNTDMRCGDGAAASEHLPALKTPAPNTATSGSEDAPCERWSSLSLPESAVPTAPFREACLQSAQAGLLALGSFRFRSFPYEHSLASRDDKPEHIDTVAVANQSPITAAGPRRIPGQSTGHRLPFSLTPAICKATVSLVIRSKSSHSNFPAF